MAQSHSRLKLLRWLRERFHSETREQMKFDDWCIHLTDVMIALLNPSGGRGSLPILDLARRHFVSISANRGVLMHKYRVSLAHAPKCAIWPMVVRAELASPPQYVYIDAMLDNACQCLTLLRTSQNLTSI